MNELIKAVKESNIEKLNALSHTDKGNKLINKESGNTTPLNLAIKLNKLDVVDAILRFRDIDVNYHDPSNEPPIHTAVNIEGNFPVFRRLLQVNAVDINKKNSKDQYPVSELFQKLPRTYTNWSSPLAEEVSLKFLEFLRFDNLEVNYSFKIQTFNLPLLFYVVQLGPLNAEAILNRFFNFPDLDPYLENAEGLNVIEFLLYMYLNYHQKMTIIDERIKYVLKFPIIQKLIRPKTLEIVKAKSKIFDLPYYYLLFKKYNILPQNKKVSQILDNIES